ncbi:hypothetical protein [Candidatus Magnetaquicoccus inordinatus]|uniref:hypothetical protein n=1 Tax=Candidatus Magnetaquicoccus inordinatus TaxID=2496818 RepID=UPI00102B54C6|nr:hypothetical protein [Candidatus Magnetaquicoccus inordinatus]
MDELELLKNTVEFLSPIWEPFRNAMYDRSQSIFQDMGRNVPEKGLQLLRQHLLQRRSEVELQGAETPQAVLPAASALSEADREWLQELQMLLQELQREQKSGGVHVDTLQGVLNTGSMHMEKPVFNFAAVEKK